MSLGARSRIGLSLWASLAVILVTACVIAWFSNSRATRPATEAPAIEFATTDPSEVLTELARFHAGDAVDGKFAVLLWAPDSSKLACFSAKQQNASVRIYDLETGPISTIESNARLSMTATTWCSGGKRLLIGLNDAPALPSAKWPEYTDATLLREYDPQTGATVREFKCADLGGQCTWARYSSDGKRIVVSIEVENPYDLSTSPREWAMTATQNQNARRTLVIESDAAITEVAKGDDAYLMPEFTADDKWLVHKRTVYPSSAVPVVSDILENYLNLPPRPAPREDIIVLSSATGSSSEVNIDTIPDAYTQLITYLDPKGSLKIRYEIQNDADYDHDTARWEIWEWEETTGKTRMRANLFKSLSASFHWPIPSGTISLNEYSDDVLLSLRPPEKRLGTKWILHFDTQPRMKELQLPEGAGNYVKLCPDGSKVAFVDDQNMVRIAKRTAE